MLLKEFLEQIVCKTTPNSYISLKILPCFGIPGSHTRTVGPWKREPCHLPLGTLVTPGRGSAPGVHVRVNCVVQRGHVCASPFRRGSKSECCVHMQQVLRRAEPGEGSGKRGGCVKSIRAGIAATKNRCRLQTGAGRMGHRKRRRSIGAEL